MATGMAYDFWAFFFHIFHQGKNLQVNHIPGPIDSWMILDRIPEKEIYTHDSKISSNSQPPKKYQLATENQNV